jgi:hypothetical protein
MENAGQEKMADAAYIGVSEDCNWTLFYGDGSEAEEYVLAIGRPFETGAGIREAVAELQVWAAENGYEIVTPCYSTHDIPLHELIEPELYDELFGNQAE